MCVGVKLCHNIATDIPEISIQGFSAFLSLVTLFICPELHFLAIETGEPSSDPHYANSWEVDVQTRMPIFSLYTRGSGYKDRFANVFFPWRGTLHGGEL